MVLTEVYFGLGSNQGDRRRNLETALEELDRSLGSHYSALSGFIRTKSWGFDGADFLNAVVRYELRLPEGGSMEESGLDLLDRVKRIEALMGRKERIETKSDGQRVYHDRNIDIDILFMGNASVSHERLQLPHPLIARREFVLIPLKEVATSSLREHYPEIFET